MKKILKIACKGAGTLRLNELHEFQGDLKKVIRKDLNQFKKQVIELGFSEPFSVWKNGKLNYILNGHQRLKGLCELQNEGYEIPPLPISWVDAKSYSEAKKKCLALAQTIGYATENGLIDFLDDSKIDFDHMWVKKNIRFPELKLDKIFNDIQENENNQKDLSEEIEEMFSIEVKLNSEKEQRKLFEELTERKFEC